MSRSQKTLEFLRNLEIKGQFFNVRLLSNKIAYV
jgi:hypothetical protein